MYVHIYNLICLYRRVCVHMHVNHHLDQSLIDFTHQHRPTHTYKDIYVCINECVIIYMSTNIPIKPE